MGGEITSTYHYLHTTLQPTVLTGFSLFGVFHIVCIVAIIWANFPKVIRMILSLLGYILFWEICHLIVFQTGVGNAVPFLKFIFRYTVLSALAQLCVGTPIADGLLWAQASVTTVCMRVYHGIAGWFR